MAVAVTGAGKLALEEVAVQLRRRSAACQRRVEARSLRYDLHYSQNFDDDSLVGSSGGHRS